MPGAGDRLSDIEILAGLPLGLEPMSCSSADVVPPRVALDAVLRPALQRTPCLVAFSGGRDSSALLAAAAALARREGLPPPIPATLEFPAPRTRETEWQELVVRHLQLDEWVRIELTDELDLVGEIATGVMRRHGQLYPANSHLVVPLAARAQGGSLLTGIAGDVIFGYWGWQDVADVLGRRRPPRRGDLRRLAHWAAPRELRAQVLTRRGRVPTYEWLHEPVRSQVRHRVAREFSTDGRLFGDHLRGLMRSREWRVSARAVATLGADHDVAVHSPFLDQRFLHAMAVAGGRWGWGNRTATMRTLFADLLPDSLLSRPTKAEFSQPFFASATKRFVEEWDGQSGIDEQVLDGEILRRAWLSPQPPYVSSTLLQATWLAQAGNREPTPQLSR